MTDSPNCCIAMLPLEIILKIIGHLTENEVVSTAKTLRNLSLSCKSFSTIVKRPLYEFNARMVKNFKENRTPEIDWRPWSSLDWAAKNGRKQTVEAVMEYTPEICELFHVNIAIKSKKYEIAWMLLKQEKLHNELKTGIQSDSPIFEAVAAGDTQLIDYIISIQGLAVSMVDLAGKSVLHHACENGHLDLVRRFLLADADPVLVSYNSLKPETPLSLAISCANSETRVTIVREILDLEPDLFHLKSCMRAITTYDRLDVLEIFIEVIDFDLYFADLPDEMETNFWRYCLSKAAKNLAVATFRKLLELCPQEKYKMTFVLHVLESSCSYFCPAVGGEDMHLAAVQIANLFIDHIRLSHNNLSFLTYKNLRVAMSAAIGHDNIPLVECILDLSGPLQFNQIPSYSLDGYRTCADSSSGPLSADMLHMLIKHGLNINQKAGDRTPLHVALRSLVEVARGWGMVWTKKLLRLAKDLASMVQDIDEVNSQGETALQYWLRISADNSDWDPYEPTPRHWFCMTMERNNIEDQLRLDIIACLLDRKASISVRNQEGDTVLHNAVSNGSLSMVKLLLDHGANVNARNKRGETPLHAALNETHAINKPLRKTRLLLDYQANPDCMSYKGTFALHPVRKIWQIPELLTKTIEIYLQTTQREATLANIGEFLNRETAQGRLALIECAFDSLERWSPERLLDYTNEAERMVDFERLLELGADIDRYDWHGTNPLTVALEPARNTPWDPESEESEESFQLFLYLLRKGANINAKNKQGRTILDVERSQQATVGFLRKHGAKFSSELTATPLVIK